jgi:hypothetical protein
MARGQTPTAFLRQGYSPRFAYTLVRRVQAVLSYVQLHTRYATELADPFTEVKAISLNPIKQSVLKGVDAASIC